MFAIESPQHEFYYSNNKVRGLSLTFRTGLPCLHCFFIFIKIFHINHAIGKAMISLSEDGLAMADRLQDVEFLLAADRLGIDKQKLILLGKHFNKIGTRVLHKFHQEGARISLTVWDASCKV